MKREALPYHRPMTKPFPGDAWSRPGGDRPVVLLVTAPVQRPRAAPAEPAYPSAKRTVPFHVGGLSSSSGSLAMLTAIRRLVAGEEVPPLASPSPAVPVLFREVVAFSSEQPHTAFGPPSHDAEAVMLDLVNPAGTCRRLLRGPRKTRLDETGWMIRSVQHCRSIADVAYAAKARNRAKLAVNFAKLPELKRLSSGQI